MGCGHSSPKVLGAAAVAHADKQAAAERSQADAGQVQGADAAAVATLRLVGAQAGRTDGTASQQPATVAARNSDASVSSVEASAVSGSSSIGTPPSGWRGGKPPKSRRGTKPHGKLETLQEPSNSGGRSPSEPSKQISDSAGSDNIRPLNKMFPPGNGSASAPPQAPSTGAAALPSPVSVQAASAANPDKPPPELAHVLSLLSRLLSASAVLVDLKDPPAMYIRQSAELRSSTAEEAATLRQAGGYQEVELLGRGNAPLGTLGAIVPGGSSTPSPMLKQMAGVVVREVEMLQAAASVRRGSFVGAAEEDASFSGGTEWRPPTTPAVALVDTSNASWRTLAVEDGIEAISGTPAEKWKDASLWDFLMPPFGHNTGAWTAVNEVAASSGDLIITGVGCRADPSRGPLVLRCTPANAALLAAQARPQEWMDLLSDLTDRRKSSGDVETAQTSADVMASTAQAFASGKGAAAATQQRQRQPYLVTVARESPLGFQRVATDSGRWTPQASSSQGRTGSSGGPMADEMSQGIPIDGVQLGPMLGKGSYGRVYHGYWNGSEVAIKVCTQGIARSGDRTVKPWAGVEAVASLALQHRGVMRTLNHTTVVVPAPPPRNASVRHASLHIPELNNSAGAPHVQRASFDLGPVARGGGAPAMVRSRSSDLDLGAENPTHGTQLARPLPIAALRGGLEPASPDGSGGRAAGAAAATVMPPAILSPFAAPRSDGAAAPPPQGGPPNFSPFADALRAGKDPAPNGSGSGSGGTGSGSSDWPRSSPNGTLAAPVALALRGNSLNAPEAGANSFRGLPVAEQQAEVDTWVVMEYCNRGTLQRALEDGLFSFEDQAGNRRPNMKAVLVAAKQLAAAMAYMHERGVIHGDLSRANILLMDSEDSPSGFDIKVADFGMARQLDVQSRIDTFSCGTITHTAPELMDEGHLSKAADVFAAGVLMWELWAGCGAWSGMNQAQIISAVLIHNKRPVFPEDAPREYADMARQCMATNPKQRPTFSEIERRVDVMLAKLDAANGSQ